MLVTSTKSCNKGGKVAPELDNINFLKLHYLNHLEQGSEQFLKQMWKVVDRAKFLEDHNIRIATPNDIFVNYFSRHIFPRGINKFIQSLLENFF